MNKLVDYLFSTKYDIKLSLIEKVIILIGLLFILIAVDSYFIWNGGILLNAIAFALMCCTLCLINKSNLRLQRNKLPFFVSFCVFICLFAIFRCDNFAQIAYRIIAYSPALMIVLWPNRLIYMLYRYYYKIVCFFAIGSALISVCGALGLLDYIPYFVLQPRSALHQRMDVDYYVYCGFLTNHNILSQITIPRACGFLQEPGHFAITLGIIYIIERLQNHIPNFVIIICGLLTFSSNFILMAGMVEVVLITKKNNYKKIIKYILVVTTLILGVYILPKSTQEDITYLFIDRNLGSVIEAASISGSLENGLDQRINAYGDVCYKNFIKTGNIWIGTGDAGLDEEIILSDYRGIIMTGGILALLYVLNAIFASVRALPFKDQIPLLGALILVFLHRSWMFNSAYLYLLCFMGSIVVRMSRIIDFSKGLWQVSNSTVLHIK